MSGRPVLAFDPARRTNAQASADLAQLGILRDHDRVLDVTVGMNAGFWTQWRPPRLVTNDLDPAVEADHHYDGTALPFPARAFDVVVWDPPYKYQGADRLASNGRYRLTGPYLAPDCIDRRLLTGTLEALRVATRLVLVKCQKQNVWSRFRFPDQPFAIAELVCRHGATVVAELYLCARREQPVGKRQINVWGYPSVLLVIDVSCRARNDSGGGHADKVDP